MRLTKKQVNAIRETFAAYFMHGDKIWLFGSRVDDTKRGGDIDLYIETHYRNLTEIFEKKMQFSRTLQTIIGEQKIDIVINAVENGRQLPIYDEARNTGILLLMTKQQEFLNDYIDIADIHASRLSESVTQIDKLMPLTATVLRKLPFAQVALLDVMTTRFDKLQDIIGSKIFSLILTISGEQTDSMTFIDKLNKLEKLSYIEDTNWWIDLRKLRNDIVHEYPNDYEIIAERMPRFIMEAEALLQFWNGLKVKINSLRKSCQK